MMATPDAGVFTPGLNAGDAYAQAWLRQATLRLRREVCWRWHQRGLTPPSPTVLAPFDTVSPLQDSLDLVRFQDAKQRFFESDLTASYLTEMIAAAGDEQPRVATEQGSFTWAVEALRLDDVSTFALALGLLARFDAAAAPVIASCQNDANRGEPALALVQRLWDEPEACLALADAGHPLWRYGLLRPTAGAPGDCDAPYHVPPLVAAQLLGVGGSEAFVAAGDPTPAPDAALPLVDRLRVAAGAMQVVVVRGKTGAAYDEAVAGVAQAAGRTVCRPVGAETLRTSPGYLHSLLTLAWLRGVDLVLHEDPSTGEHRAGLLPVLAASRDVPVTVFVVNPDAQDVAGLPTQMLLPQLTLPPLTYEERIECLREGLGAVAVPLGAAIAEAARRFRFETATLRSICDGLLAHEGELTAAQLFAACRAAMPVDVGALTRPVTPRFRPEELVLAPAQQQQLDEIERAMRSLTAVHYLWGTSRVWNESGISVLFGGPSGTGKTMAAEVLAAKLDLPMLYVNLSQVVNKYIGETEKNLERVFDAADVTETLLFFDEADSLFGRRTEVKDSHDRYANLEVSYLLERMERFKGLAILATNRRSDLDEAFVRRLRYIVDFVVPDVAQRRTIWERVVPEGVDASALDFEFLARRFQLTGGNIRSAVFNACLQSAESPGPPRLAMEPVVVAVKREYDKLHRTTSVDQFGPYAKLIEELTHA